MEKCPHCGAATRPGAKFCTSCGTRLAEPAVTPDTSWSNSAGENETLVATPAASMSDATREVANNASPQDWTSPSSDTDVSSPDGDETPEDTAEETETSSEESSTTADKTGETLSDDDSGWGGKWPAAPTTPSNNESPADRFKDALNGDDPEADISASSQQPFPERSVWSWGAPTEANTASEAESAKAPSGDSEGDASASSWPTPPADDDKTDEVATESETIVPGTDAAGFSGAGEVDALSGDESITADPRSWEPSNAETKDASDDARSRATALIDQLRALIWQIDVDASATRDNPTIVSNLRRARGVTRDFSDLEGVIGNVKEHPRDIDALRDLGQQADRLQELLDSHTTLTAVIEDAIRQGTPE